MKDFRSNVYGGIDVLENDKFLVHLSSEDLKTIYEIQQKNYDVDTVRDRIPDWVAEQLEGDDYFFEDFNSHLFSDDEISDDEIWQKLLSDEGLIQKIADEYRSIYDSGAQMDDGPDWWYALNEAIGNNVSIKDVMGEVLCEKHHKELLVGQWRVLVIEQGDLYGTVNRVPWKDEEPCVEFYDMYADAERYPDGRFTTGRYMLSYLVSGSYFEPSLAGLVDENKGFNLNPNYSEWTIRTGDLNIISAWLKAVHKQMQEKTIEKPFDDKLADAVSRADGSTNERGQKMEKEGLF